LRGRGTRVFQAVELDGNGEPNGSGVVLKDFWIDSDRMREGNILRSLHKAADDADKKLVERHFLTTICHGDVRIGPIFDDTANALMRGLEIPKDYGSLFKLQRHPIVQNFTPATGSEGLRATARVQNPNRRHQRYEHKTHYRIVFKEIGTAIDSMESFPDVMNVLKDIAGGAFYGTLHL
jgi:hypothetical protein